MNNYKETEWIDINSVSELREYISLLTDDVEFIHKQIRTVLNLNTGKVIIQIRTKETW